MPTGYTVEVVDGKISDFPTFAKLCARAFGALIHMRDNTISPDWSPIVEPELEIYQQRLDKIAGRIAELEGMSDEVADRAYIEYAANLDIENERHIARCADQDSRLAAMTEKVRAWAPPTPDHIGMKEFMLEQLRISANGDVRRFYTKPLKMTGPEWRAQQLGREYSEIAITLKSIEDEKSRAESRTKWLTELVESLK